MKVLLGVLLTIVFALGVSFWWSGRDTTIYAKGFDEDAFRQVKPGMEIDQVHRLIGEPLAARQENGKAKWCYGKESMEQLGSTTVVNHLFCASRCVLLDETGKVVDTTGDDMEGVRSGMTSEEVLAALGEPSYRAAPTDQTLHYSKPGGEGLFRARIVGLGQDHRVSEVISYEFFD
jgi:outer membrane protein assembly factor BamE (lipoprotein component of BamABCDE complex)